MALSGGGLCGLSYLGCIRFLQMENLTAHLRHISGTSIGAFFACAIALDIPYQELETLLKEHSRDDALAFDTTQFVQLFTSMGIRDAEFLVSPLQKYIKKKFDMPTITFLELSKSTGKNLVVCASCVEKGDPTYFCVDRTPHVRVLDAVKASMSLPILVKPVKIGEYHYVDGGITDNHPVTCFCDPPPASMLSIKVCAKVHIPENVLTSLPNYLATLFCTYFHQIDKQYQKTKWSLLLNESPVPFLTFKYEATRVHIVISDEDIDNAIAYGYCKLQDWFNCMNAPCP